MATPQLYSYRNAVLFFQLQRRAWVVWEPAHVMVPRYIYIYIYIYIHHCTVQIGTFCVSAINVWELGGSPGTRGDPASAIAARSEHNPDRVWPAYLLTIHSRATASKSALYMNFSKQKWRASTSHKSSNRTSIESAGATLGCVVVEWSGPSVAVRVRARARVREWNFFLCKSVRKKLCRGIV